MTLVSFSWLTSCLSLFLRYFMALCQVVNIMFDPLNECKVNISVWKVGSCDLDLILIVH